MKKIDTFLGKIILFMICGFLSVIIFVEKLYVTVSPLACLTYASNKVHEITQIASYETFISVLVCAQIVIVLILALLSKLTSNAKCSKIIKFLSLIIVLVGILSVDYITNMFVTALPICDNCEFVTQYIYALDIYLGFGLFYYIVSWLCIAFVKSIYFKLFYNKTTKRASYANIFGSLGLVILAVMAYQLIIVYNIDFISEKFSLLNKVPFLGTIDFQQVFTVTNKLVLLVAVFVVFVVMCFIEKLTLKSIPKVKVAIKSLVMLLIIAVMAGVAYIYGNVDYYKLLIVAVIGYIVFNIIGYFVLAVISYIVDYVKDNKVCNVKKGIIYAGLIVVSGTVSVLLIQYYGTTEISLLDNALNNLLKSDNLAVDMFETRQILFISVFSVVLFVLTVVTTFVQSLYEKKHKKSIIINYSLITLLFIAAALAIDIFFVDKTNATRGTLMIVYFVCATMFVTLFIMALNLLKLFYVILKNAKFIETTDLVEEETEETVEEETEETEETEEVFEEETEELDEEIEEAVEEETEDELDEEVEEETEDLDSDLLGVASSVELVDRYNFSFTARMCQSEEVVKEQYEAIMNKIALYKKVSTRMTWKYVSVNRGYKKLIRLVFTGKKLSLYFAFYPNADIDPKYHLKDFSEKKMYEQIPMRLKITSARALKYALELVELIMKENEVELYTRPVEVVDYVSTFPSKTTEELMDENLVKHSLVEYKPFSMNTSKE